MENRARLSIKEKSTFQITRLIIDRSPFTPEFLVFSKTIVSFEDWVFGKLQETVEDVSDEIVPILYDDITKSKELHFNG